MRNRRTMGARLRNKTPELTSGKILGTAVTPTRRKMDRAELAARRNIGSELSQVIIGAHGFASVSKRGYWKTGESANHEFYRDMNRQGKDGETHNQRDYYFVPSL